MASRSGPAPVLIVAGLAALAGGCSQPAPTRPDITAEALGVTGAPPATFAAPVSTATGAVAAGWIASFKDPVLDALVAEALTGNRDLAAARARLDQAASQARLAGADLKPQIGASLGAGAQGSDGARTDQMGAGLTLSWELDIWGRISSGVKAAADQYASAEADVAFARQSLAAQVAKAWFLAIQAVRQEAIAQEFATIQQRSAELVAKREQHGRASAYDTALARSAAATAEDRVRQAQSGRERAVRSLEILLGRYPRAELATGATLPAMPPPTPAGLPSEILERRPDLIAAERRILSAFNMAESARAARLPRLSITANAGLTAGSFRDMSLDDVFWNTAANLVGPLFDGGRLKSQAEIQDGIQKEAVAAYGATALRAFQQVEQALAEERRLAARQALVDAADTAQSEALRLSQRRLDAGVIDQIALLTVQGRALDARLAALSVQVERLTNRVDLHLALGGDFALPATAAVSATAAPTAP
jgi:multidrug efflux system outer membrane protein